MSELANTYLARLPMELQLLLVERLKVPEITIIESEYEYLSIKIKYHLTVTLHVDEIPCYFPIKNDPNRIFKLKEKLTKFKISLLDGKSCSAELTEDIDFKVKPGSYLIKTVDMDLDLGTMENMVLLVDKIVEYITPLLTEKFTPSITKVNE